LLILNRVPLHKNEKVFLRTVAAFFGNTLNKILFESIDSKKAVWTGKALSTDITVVVSTIKN